MANTPGDDSLRRQQEHERILREQQESRPDVRLERSPIVPSTAGIPTNERPCFQVNHILLTGDGSADFQWLLKHASVPGEPLLGRCLGAQGINVVMGRMQNALVAAGYVTSRVLASPQDLKAGHLNLTLMLGRIRQLRLIDPQGYRATLRNALPLRPGDVLNLRGIEQGLENLKRVPSADADIQITPAEGNDAQPGDSDLLIRWQQSSPFRLALTVDDAGSNSTGKYLGSATVSYDHWWTLNDLFYVSATRSLGGGEEGKRGSKSHTVHYSVPWGYWLFGMTTSQHRYHQFVAGDSVDYVYSGTSANQEISLSRLLYRDGVSKVQTSLRGWKRESAYFINDAEVGVQRRRTGGWEWGLNYRRYIGRASLDMNTSVKRGTGANRSLAAPEEQDGVGTSRPFIVFANAQLNVPFHLNEQALRYGMAWRAQWNRTPLVALDRFAIGGRNTVRGFSGESVLAAERGWLVRNDFGMPLGNSGQELYVGIDYGRVAGPSTERLLGNSLSGVAFGLRGAVRNLTFDVFSGRALHKPDRFGADGMNGGFTMNLAF